MSLKGIPVKCDKLTSEPNKITTQEESKEDSNEANALDQVYISVSDASDVESKEDLPGTLPNAQLHLTHHVCMESKESSTNGDDDHNALNAVGDYARP
jgi:hypothetical protein